MIRLATHNDIEVVTAIYDHIHKMEAEGLVRIGWNPSVYPVRTTAEEAIQRGDLFVFEQEGIIMASAIINRTQVPVYATGQWAFPAADDEVMVLHTLILRLDTNAVNSIARKMYPSLGYREAGIVPCIFNGIPNVQLVLFEKSLR